MIVHGMNGREIGCEIAKMSLELAKGGAFYSLIFSMAAGCREDRSLRCLAGNAVTGALLGVAAGVIVGTLLTVVVVATRIRRLSERIFKTDGYPA